MKTKIHMILLRIRLLSFYVVRKFNANKQTLGLAECKIKLVYKVFQK